MYFLHERCFLYEGIISNLFIPNEEDDEENGMRRKNVNKNKSFRLKVLFSFMLNSQVLFKLFQNRKVIFLLGFYLQRQKGLSSVFQNLMIFEKLTI